MSKALAWIVAACLIFIAVFCIGGIKLNSRYRAVEKAFTAAVSTPDSAGDIFAVNYSNALTAAQSFAACAEQLLPESSYARQQLASCVKAAEDAASKPAEGYKAMSELYTAADLSYHTIQTEDNSTAAGLKAAWDEFNSKYSVIKFNYSSAYNSYVAGMESVSSGFPSNVIKKLWGIGNNEN